MNKENKLKPDELVNLLNQELIKQRDDYKSRCEKLREYINTHQLFKYIYDEEELFEIITDKEAKKDLENILNGGENNV